MGGLLIPIFVRLKGPERILVVLGVLAKPRFYVNTEMSGYWPPKSGECDGMGHRRDLSPSGNDRGLKDKHPGR